ncbi:MAG TPA: hypothetical protein VKY33_02070 [Flavobacterium sp.]|nr:hypothetical protein [Flavobacterium sp.]
MKKIVLICLGLFLSFSCQKKNVETPPENSSEDSLKKSDFQMYEMSEMASLMEQMYAYNLQLKERIINEDSLGSYPEAFDKLHYAVLTEASDRDAFFNEQSYLFLAAQKAIYEVEKPKESFNRMVNQCLECHAKKCGGPIPRIKKLIIP